jgi:hypothetical protein
MKKIETVDDLKKMCAEEVLRVVPDCLSNPSRIEPAALMLARDVETENFNKAAGNVVDYAEEMMNHMTGSKKAWSTIVSEMRATRMTVTTEIDLTEKAFSKLAKQAETAIAAVSAFERLKECLKDPAIKGFLK